MTRLQTCLPKFANLARQMYPKWSHYAVESYKNATREFSSGTGRRFTTADEHISPRDALRAHGQMSRRVKMYLPVLKRITKLGDKAEKTFAI